MRDLDLISERPLGQQNPRAGALDVLLDGLEFRTVANGSITIEIDVGSDSDPCAPIRVNPDEGPLGISRACG